METLKVVLKRKFDLLVKEDILGRKATLVFVVIDSELGDCYPANFVCIFPVTFNKTSVFSKLFEDYTQARQESERLLLGLKAKNTEKPKILAEIEKRLKRLQSPKPIETKKCVDCGTVFSTNRPHQKRCHPCSKKAQYSFQARLGKYGEI